MKSMIVLCGYRCVVPPPAEQETTADFRRKSAVVSCSADLGGNRMKSVIVLCGYRCVVPPIWEGTG